MLKGGVPVKEDKQWTRCIVIYSKGKAIQNNQAIAPGKGKSAGGDGAWTDLVH